MKKQFFLVIVLCWAFTQLAAQIAFRHVTTAANTGATAGTSAHITVLDHPQLNGNPKAIIFILPNFNLNGAEATGQDYKQNAGVWYDSGRSRWTIFNQNTKEPMPLNMTFNVMVAPPNSPNCFTFTVTEASKTGFGNSAFMDHPATNGKSNAMLLLTQNWAEARTPAVLNAFLAYSQGKLLGSRPMNQPEVGEMDLVEINLNDINLANLPLIRSTWGPRIRSAAATRMC